LFEPSSQDSFPALEPIPSIIPPGDGRIPTAKPFSPTAASLQHYLETLPAVPENSHMPNLLLSTLEIRDVAAFIVSLRDKPAAPTQ
jgi:hypothetical protein